MSQENKKLTLLLLVLVGICVCVAYIPAIQSEFIWDDDDYVTENPTLRTPQGLADIWTERYSIPQWYPLVHTTFWLEYQAWQLNARGYHVTNVLIHVASMLLLFLVLRRLAVPGALLAVAIFGLHPVMVESVAWITERKNVLSLFCYLLSLLCYLRCASVGSPEDAAEPTALQRWTFYALSLALFVLALLSKTVTCSMPAVVLLLIVWKRARIRWADFWPTLPFFAVGLWLAMRTATQEQERVQAIGPEWDLSFTERLLVAGRAIWFYAYKLVWPAELVFIYERWQLDTGAFWQYLFPVGVAIALVVLFMARHRIGRGPVVAACIFCGTLTPALGFFNVFPMRYSFVADHFQYHASIALIALFAAAVVGVFQRAGSTGLKLGLPLAVFVLVVLGVGTAKQCRSYKNLETLYSSILESVPDSWFALNNLGVVYSIDAGTRDKALRLFRKAKSVNPELDREGLEPAADVSPGAFAFFQVGVILAKSTQTIAKQLPDQEKHRRLRDAVGFFRRALKLDNNYKRAHSNLAGALGYLDDQEGAVFHFGEALRIDQKDDSLRIQLATRQMGLAQRHAAAGRQGHAHKLVRAAEKNLRASVTNLEQALRDNPKNKGTRVQLSNAHMVLADALRAQGLEQGFRHHRQEAERIFRSDPDR